MSLKSFTFVLLASLIAAVGAAASTNTTDTCETLTCEFCCLDDSNKCADEARDCAEETDDDYIEKDIFYIVGAFFGLWVLYKVFQRAYTYYQSRKEHAKLTEG
mmetsp:Transcript_23379/g.41487  ORF Transcript_23379/g.41487 Transcript_23379/m.41487 type:complete len:103 (-) Transcript_23379:872-1180(-)